MKASSPFRQAFPSAGRRARTHPSNEAHFLSIAGTTGAMRDLFRLVEKAAAGTSAVLIEGETGTGKELIARAIHSHGPRRERVFIAQNCAALPEPLLESELFGHVRGAFTGALRSTRGLLAMADRGTVFLDEIVDCSPAVQAKLLRFLQDGAVRPVGGTRERALDVRIISATNRRIEEEVAEGNFRKDLFYRLNVIPIRVPPLRERRGDIPRLASFFLSRYADRSGKRMEGFTREAMELLVAYEYPGNVRELENEIEKGVLLIPEGGMIDTDALSEKFSAARPAGAAPAFSPEQMRFDQAVAAVQREWIAHALKKHGGNKTKAAEELGMDRKTLNAMIERLGL